MTTKTDNLNTHNVYVLKVKVNSNVAVHPRAPQTAHQDAFSTLPSGCAAPNWVCNHLIERGAPQPFLFDTGGPGPTILVVLVIYLMFKGIKTFFQCVFAPINRVGPPINYAPPATYPHNSKLFLFGDMYGHNKVGVNK